MKRLIKSAVLAMALALGGQAQAATFILNLNGNVGSFTNFQQDAFGLHFDRYFLNLSGLDSDNAITVAQGDVIDSTVTFDRLLTIGASEVRTDILQFLFGTGFTGGNTSVAGTFNFFNDGTLVSTLTYESSTSSQLASFSPLFPPANGAFSFDSFTNSLTITGLDAPATLNASAFNYNLVSAAAAVPEPGTWAMMIFGFGMIGGTMRRRKRLATACLA